MSDERTEDRSKTMAHEAMAAAHPAEYRRRLAEAEIKIRDEKAAAYVLYAMASLTTTAAG